MRHVLRHLVVLVGLSAAASSAAAQLPQVGVPRGHIRLEIGGDFSTVNGSFLDGRHPFRSEWNAELGSAFLPELTNAESQIRAITGDASYRLSAGRSSVRASTQTGSVVLSAAVGVTSRLTIFGTMPFVRARAQSNLRIDSTSADAGFNPWDPQFGTGAGALQTNAFFTQLDAALVTLAGKITNGDYNGDPAMLALAQSTLVSGGTLRSQMNDVLRDPAGGSAFVPLATSTAGTAILGVVNTLQATMATLSINSFTTDPALATARLKDDQYRDFITNSFGHVQGFMLGDETIQRPGDTELGAVYTLIDRWGDRRTSFRLAFTGLVRLPTGMIDRSDDFFDAGTGEGQTDVEFRAAADFATGIIGARASAGYNRQLEADYQRRIYAPSQPLAYRYRLATVNSDPGDELTLGIEPFLRLAPGFALTIGAFHWRHGHDVISYVSSPIPGVDATDLAIGSERSATSVQGGLTFSSFSGTPGSRRPIEARVAYREVVAATGGAVDQTKQLWFQVRVYYKVW